MPGKTYLHKILFLFFGFLFTFGLQAANELDTLRFPELSESAAYFREHYRETLWNLDSAEAIREFDALLRAADRSGDKELEISILTAKGLFYQQRVDNGLPKAIEVLKGALKKAERHKQDINASQITHFIGYTYFLMEDYPPAFGYMLDADKKMKKIGYNSIPNICRFGYRLGVAYFTFDNYDRARYYLERASEYAVEDEEIQVGAAGLIGVIYYYNKEYGEALSWYEKALDLAENSGDSVTIGVIQSNLGQLYTTLDQEEKARSLLQSSYEAGKKYHDYKNAAKALLHWANLEVREGNIDAALEKTDAFEKFVQAYSFNYSLEQKADYEKVMSNIYSALQDYRLAKVHLDNYLVLKDSLQAEKDANMVANLEVQAITEKHMGEMALMEERESRQKVIRNASFALLGMALILFTVIIYNLKKRQKQKEEIYLLESQKTEEQLDNYRNRLKFFIEGIREKNRLIKELQREREEQDLAEQTGLSQATSSNSVIERLYDSVILTDTDWHNFKMLFEKAYPGLLQKLLIQCPKLTTADIRILSLMKLNLSISEMSGMLGISPESVSQSRRRLWKKLDLKNYREIPLYLDKVWETTEGHRN